MPRQSLRTFQFVSFVAVVAALVSHFPTASATNFPGPVPAITPPTSGSRGSMTDHLDFRTRMMEAIKDHIYDALRGPGRSSSTLVSTASTAAGGLPPLSQALLTDFPNLEQQLVSKNYSGATEADDASDVIVPQKKQLATDEPVKGIVTTGHGRRREAWTTKQMRSLAEKVMNATDDGVVQFRLASGDASVPRKTHRRRSTSGGDLQVTSATVNVLLRPIATSGKQQPRDSDKPAAAAVATKARRLGIKIYRYDENERTELADKSNASTAVGDSDKSMSSKSPLVAELQLTAPSRHRRRHSSSASWQALLLPTTFVQDALDSPSRVVRIRIVCDGCESAGRQLVVAGGGDLDNGGRHDASRPRLFTTLTESDSDSNATPEPDRQRHRHQRKPRHKNAGQGATAGTEGEREQGKMTDVSDQQAVRHVRGKRNKVQISSVPYLVVQVKRRPTGWRCLPSGDMRQSPICRADL